MNNNHLNKSFDGFTARKRNLYEVEIAGSDIIKAKVKPNSKINLFDNQRPTPQKTKSEKIRDAHKFRKDKRIRAETNFNVAKKNYDDASRRLNTATTIQNLNKKTPRQKPPPRLIDNYNDIF